MKKFLFSNVSYFIGVNIPKEFHAHLKSHCTKFGLHFNPCADLNEVVTDLKKIRHVVGICINVEGVDLSTFPKQLTQLPTNLSSKVTFIYKDGEKNSPDKKYIKFTQFTNEGFSQLLETVLINAGDKNFNNLMIESTNRIGKSIFPGIEVVFSQGEALTTIADKRSQYDFIILCDAASIDEVYISSSIFINTSQLKKLAKTFSNKDENSCTDAAKEFLNQTLGLLTQTLQKSNHSFRIGVPFIIQNTPETNLKKSFYSSPVILVDNQGIFRLEVGVVNLGTRLFAFDDVKLVNTEEDGEIQFL
jgi:hypothetical protein